MPDPCVPIQRESDDLKEQIKSLQKKLGTAPPAEKKVIIADIKALREDLLRNAQSLERCHRTFVEPNVYQCDDGALYYVREAGNNFHWFGERRDGAFSNIFTGQRTGSIVTGRWFDIPKGRSQNSGTLRIAIDTATNTFKRLSQTGGFGGQNWLPHKPYANSPSLRASRLFRKAGFQGANANDLSGTWMSDNQGTYYLRQIGNEIFWYGEGQTFSSIFIGTRSGETISGSWFDVPKGETNASGTLSMNLGGSLAKEDGLFTLSRSAETGGFASLRLSRVESLNLDLSLDTLIIHKTNDLALGDEPFLWVVVIKVDGDKLDIFDLSQVHATLLRSPGSHSNITSEGNIDAGRRLPIPSRVGKYSTVLKTIRGLEPLIAGEASARNSTTIAVLAIALEEDSTSNDAIEAGHQALNAELQTGIDKALALAIATKMPPDFSALTEELSDLIKAAVKSAEDKIFGFIDPDDLVGVEFARFNFAELLQEGTSIPINLNLIKCVRGPNISQPPHPQCPVGSPRGTVLTQHYEVTGEIRIS